MTTVLYPNRALFLVLAFLAASTVTTFANDANNKYATKAAEAPPIDPNPRPIPNDVLTYADALAGAILNNSATSLSEANLFNFLEMDLLYLEGYADWVYNGLKQCKSDPALKLLGSGILGRLVFPAASVDYYKETVLSNSSAVIPPPNAALNAYANFYKNQSTCEGTVSSMMVCLCSYSIVAEIFVEKINSGAIQDSKYLRNFINYNKDSNPLEAGTACTYSLEIMKTLDIDNSLMDQALAHEKALWHATGSTKEALHTVKRSEF